MEITWLGQGCVRLRGKEGTVVVDPFPSVVGPTGRGLTADVVAFTHPDAQPPTRRPERRAAGGGHGPGDGTFAAAGNDFPVPTSLEPAFRLTGPGEYEVHDILVTGIRTARDDARGEVRGLNTSYVFQLDGLHVMHLGDLGHLLSEEQLREIGTVDVVCVPIGGSLPAARSAEVVAQLDANLVVPLPVGESDEASEAAMARFLHEMGVTSLTPQAKLSVTPSSIPQELTVVLLEPRNRG
jgi:L-ascorbate metabolism protein UlaG (beta-lactamase superfamily)